MSHPINIKGYLHGQNQTDELHLLSECFSILEHSPTACSLMDEAAMDDWSVTLADLDDAQDYHIDMVDRSIVINMDGLSCAAIARSDYFKTYILSVLVRSLRDVAQEKRYDNYDSVYSPEHILFLSRLRTADIAAITALIGWELRDTGYAGLWRHLIGSEDGDIAMAFSAVFERTEGNRNMALSSAFEQWYKNDDRTNAADHDALDFMDNIMQEEEEETGNNNPFGIKHLSAMDVESVSCLSDKTAYLNGQGKAILRDPFYAGLADDVNQMHFMQIMSEIETVTVNNVPFRSQALAQRIFPDD